VLAFEHPEKKREAIVIRIKLLAEFLTDLARDRPNRIFTVAEPPDKAPHVIQLYVQDRLPQAREKPSPEERVTKFRHAKHNATVIP
jgi:hypothetical protein